MGKAAMARCTRRRKKGWSKEEKNRNKSWVQHEDIQKRKEDILCLSHRWGWPVSLLLKLEWKGNSRAVGGDPAIPSLSSFTPQELSAKCWPLASLEFTWVCLTALWSSYAVTGIAFHWEWTGVWKNGKRRKRLKKKNNPDILVHLPAICWHVSGLSRERFIVALRMARPQTSLGTPAGRESPALLHEFDLDMSFQFERGFLKQVES